MINIESLMLNSSLISYKSLQQQKEIIEPLLKALVIAPSSETLPAKFIDKDHVSIYLEKLIKLLESTNSDLFKTILLSLREFSASGNIMDFQEVDKLNEKIKRYWSDYKKAYLFLNLSEMLTTVLEEIKLVIADEKLLITIRDNALLALENNDLKRTLTQNIVDFLKEKDKSPLIITFAPAITIINELIKNNDKEQIEKLQKALTDFIEHFDQIKKEVGQSRINAFFNNFLTHSLFIQEDEKFSGEVYKTYAYVHPDKLSKSPFPSILRDKILLLQEHIGEQIIFQMLNANKDILMQSKHEDKATQEHSNNPAYSEREKYARELILLLLEYKLNAKQATPEYISTTLKEYAEKTTEDLALYFYIREGEENKFDTPAYKIMATKLLDLLYWYSDLKQWQKDNYPDNSNAESFFNGLDFVSVTIFGGVAAYTIAQAPLTMLIILRLHMLNGEYEILTQRMENVPSHSIAMATYKGLNKLVYAFAYYGTNLIDIPLSAAVLCALSAVLIPQAATRQAIETYHFFELYFHGQQAVDFPYAEEPLLAPSEEEWDLVVKKPILNLLNTQTNEENLAVVINEEGEDYVVVNDRRFINTH